MGVPPATMDGPLRPNDTLEQARLVARLEDVDNLASDGSRTMLSSGSRLLSLEGDTVREEAMFDASIACVAVAGDGGTAVGLEDGAMLFRAPGAEGFDALPVPPRSCPTALMFRDDRTLIACHGSTYNPASRWRHDLMERRRSGSVWVVGLSSRTCDRLVGGLGFPCGLALSPQGGEVVVSEAWEHRLVSVPLAGPAAVTPVLRALPGYPSRMATGENDATWLCVFAPRNRLVEFVMGEEGYKVQMMRSMPPDQWIAPSLSPRRSFLEPLQCGAVRTMGHDKPWAPTRSYGLVIRLDPSFRPVASLHSRSDGTRHGVTSCVEHGSGLLVTSRGSHALLDVLSHA